MPTIRRGGPGDLEAVAEIQAASPEASGWEATAYLNQDFRVAVCENHVAGFLAGRAVAEDEREVLNLAVAERFRRRGIGRALMRSFLEGFRGTVYLEVRESNRAARTFYKSLGFQEITIRPGYYKAPEEAAIVMKFHSC